jgi:hypothetical protein
VPVPAVVTASVLGMIVMQFISFVELVSLQMLIYSCGTLMRHFVVVSFSVADS